MCKKLVIAIMSGEENVEDGQDRALRKTFLSCMFGTFFFFMNIYDLAEHANKHTSLDIFFFT